MKSGEALSWLHTVNKNTYRMDSEKMEKIVEEYANILIMLVARVEELEESRS